jgi:tetraacyldisaccharide 4'-kinase
MTIEAFYYKVISPRREFYLAPLYLILRLVSVIYSAAMLARVFLYRKGIFKVCHLQGKVIGVGNLTLGGVGKTPAVMMIAELLVKKGLNPVILSRGYKGSLDGNTGIVSDGHEVLLTSDVAGDEPVMMAERLKNVPIIVGSDRYEAGHIAIEKFGATPFVLDDSFQPLALHRDVNILLCDRSNNDHSMQGLANSKGFAGCPGSNNKIQFTS